MVFDDIYLYVLFVVIAMYNFIFHQDEYGKNELRAVWEFVVVGFVCTAIEAVYSQYLLTGIWSDHWYFYCILDTL